MGVFPRSSTLGALGFRCRGGEHISSAVELSSLADPSFPMAQGTHRRLSPELGTWVGGVSGGEEEMQVIASALREEASNQVGKNPYKSYSEAGHCENAKWYRCCGKQ